MEWTYVALLQMFLITTGVCGAMWMRVRRFKSQNDEMRTFLEEADQRVEEARKSSENLPKGPIAREWLKEQLEKVAEEEATSTVQQAVIKHLIKAERKFDQKLTKTIEKAGLGGDVAAAGGGAGDADGAPNEAQTEQINALQAEVERLKAELANDATAGEGAPADNADDPSNAEMRELLQQFTADAREMLECVTTLENENAELRGRAGPASEPETENAA